MHELTAITIAAILATAALCQWIAWRVTLPAILFLLAAGIFAGPVSGLLDPDALMGHLFFPFVSLSVAVILFEGSLTLKFHEIRGLRRVIRNLITVGIVITGTITAVAARLALGLTWEVAILFGAVMVVTGPTVIVPMLRTVRPKASVANVLRWEGILIDPVGAILAVLVFNFIVAGGGGEGLGTSLRVFGSIVLIGILVGGVTGQVLGIALRRYWLPQYMQNVAVLALVLAVFAVSNLLAAESGLLTVTIMGVWLANMQEVELDEILDFKESLSLLLISVLFILLAARLDLEAFLSMGKAALVVFAVIQFLARPVCVHAASIGSRLTWSERHLLAWIAPRGIIAAAISALFALKLETLGYSDAPLMVPLTFMVIIGTVLLQSATARPIARWLGVAEPEPRGFLMVGANPVSRAIAVELSANDLRVLMADENWGYVKDAKMEGLPAYYGNPVSEHAERNLNLVGIGRLLAMTPNEDYNALVLQHYRLEFGPNNVFFVRTRPPRSEVAEMKSPVKSAGRALFGSDVTYATLARLLATGGEIKTTGLTDNYSFQDYRSVQGENRIPLFAIDTRDRLHVFTGDRELQPAAGWKIIGLVAETVDE